MEDNSKLLPKQKFLFHVVFDTDEDLAINGFEQQEKFELNLLVKSCDLPRYGLNVEEKIQYNKKMYAATRIQYDPVNITFHDDHADTVNAFWKKYYEYHIADSVNLNADLAISETKDTAYESINDRASDIYKFGMDTPITRKRPYLRGIEIFVLHKKRFTSMTLVNPMIGSFNHDNLDYADGTGIMQNTMQIFYETVIYRSGLVSRNTIKGFADLHYDKEPSPLTVFGRGTNSLFGPGGVVDGIGSVIRATSNGNILGAIIAASNTYNNAKRIKKSDVKAELKGLAKEGINQIGRQAGSITSPVGQFAVGAAVLAGTKIASAKGTADNKTGRNNTVITNSTVDTSLYLTANEAYNLVTTNLTIRDEVAAGIYFKDIGSRKNLTVAQNDVEYAGANDTTKTVYRNKAITNVRTLVTEGYLKIERVNLDVSIVNEKETL